MTKWLSNLLLGENVIKELRDRAVGGISDEQMIKFLIIDYILKDKSCKAYINKKMLSDAYKEFEKLGESK